MKKFLTFAIVLLGFTISFANTPEPTMPTDTVEVEQMYYPGVRYTHKAWVADR